MEFVTFHETASILSLESFLYTGFSMPPNMFWGSRPKGLSEDLGSGLFSLQGVGCACVCVCVRAWSLQLCASPFSLLVVVSSSPSHVENVRTSPRRGLLSPLERRMQGVPLYCSGWWLDVLLGSSLLTPGRFRACLGSRSEFYHPGFGPVWRSS